MMPVVPAWVPLALLIALEALALGAAFFLRRERLGVVDPVLLCSRCSGLHEQLETLGRTADAVAVAALTFLLALPFLAAEYESGFAPAGVVLAVSAIAAVLAVLAEANYLARSVAAWLWPLLRWRAEPLRLIGGSARWLGPLLALYVFQPGRGLDLLFAGAGKRLVVDLASTLPLYIATALLALAWIAGALARWLIPFVVESQPLTFARRREPQGTSS